MNKKILLAILVVILFIVIGIIIISILIANNVRNRVDFKFTKVVDNIKLELNIPNEWKYEEISQNEENNFYKYALKLYKSDDSRYAMLYFYNKGLGFCGTGRTSKDIVLNNGKKATIGYYDGNREWSDISFYNLNKNIAILNYGLEDEEATEAIEFIKSINIIEDNLKSRLK